MIGFLRKIRKGLLNEGKTARYCKDANGKIVIIIFLDFLFNFKPITMTV